MESNKNGEIEFFRFVFAMCVLFVHFNGSYNFGRFVMGSIGVDFFFVVTGLLMAKNGKRLKIVRAEIPAYTYTYIFKKISVFYRYFIMTGIVQLIVAILIEKESFFNIVKDLFTSIPSYLFIKMGGYVYGSPLEVRVNWYLSAMILSILILYPILLFSYEWSTKIIFPIIGIFGLGILSINVKYIISVYEVVGIYGGMIRGLCEIALGAWGYEIALQIGKCNFTKIGIILLSILE